jgi:hypothetical protein
MLKEFGKIKLVLHLLQIKEACKTSFVHLALRKKIIQRYRRMRLEALGAFSCGA